MPNPPPRPGYVTASEQVKPRLICSLYAHEKCGKTHFAFTAPAPIAYIGMDIGDEGVIQKFQGVKTIYKADARFDLKKGKDLQDRAKEAWTYISDRYFEAFEDPAVRTIICDTGGEMWEIIRLAAFGKLTQVMPMQYGPVNAEWDGMIRYGLLRDKNVIFLHKVKEKYKGKDATGEYERKGNSGMGYLVQAEVELWKDTREPVPDRYKCTIRTCRHRPELEDMVTLEGEDCTFSTLAAMVLYGPDEYLERRKDFE